MVTTERAPIDRASELEANKTLVRRFIHEVFEQGDAKAIDELATVDYTPHGFGQQPGPAALKATQERAHAGLSDARIEIEDMIAEGDRVAVRLTSSARQTGEFMGMPASGRAYTISEIHIFRIRDRRVSEHWHEMNVASLMEQLKPKAEASAS